MKKINKEELHLIFIGIKNSDEAQFNTLCEKYRNLIYRIAFSILKNKEDSEEIVQIVLMKILQLEKEKLPSNNEANWLYTLTKNEAISLWRKKKESVDIEMLYNVEDKNNDIDDTIELMDFNKLISKLDYREKEIVALKIVSNLSFDEIAKLLNKPTGTIKWRYYKAIHMLEILISNLGMFIITFMIGIKTLFNGMTKEQIHTEEKGETEPEKAENDNNRLNNTNTNDTQKKENIEDKEEIIIDNTTVTTVVEKESKPDINYLGICAFSLSLVFFILTITTLVFFTKRQLNSKRKASK